MQLISAKQLGSSIKQVRLKLQLTQAAVAAECGTGVRFIAELERGKPTCELEKALKVAACLESRIEITETPD